jgi:superfamily II DNA or RNA helicase
MEGTWVSASEEQLKVALAECARLNAENARFRSILAAHDLLPKPVEEHPVVKSLEGSTGIHNGSPPSEKLQFFKSLFRGREDIYALRWERGEKHGYAPAADMDWNAIHAAPPDKRKQVARKTRTLRPLTDAGIRDHLEGKATIGIYPLLPDETCWLLAVDFDKSGWHEDATAFLTSCHSFNVPACLERSRSGNGGHIWIFFDRPVPAVDARRLGAALLTRTTESRHEIGLDSYDRFFPNQDTMPKGGFGNLIALPLQKVPRKSRNSVFVDDHFEPHPDQWQYLSAVQRVPADSLPALIHEVAPEGNIVGVRFAVTEEEAGGDPWLLPPSKKRRESPIAGPLPVRVRLVLSNMAYVEKKALPPALLDRLCRLAAFQNPEFYKAQAMRLSTYGKPRIISCAENFPEYIGLPRGCLQDALDLFRQLGIATEIQDERFSGRQLDVEFQGTLLPAQNEAVALASPHDIGVICAPTAFGKTAVGAWLIAQRKVNTLVVVHRQQLLDQWRARLATFLDLPAASIGQIGGGKTARTGEVDVAVIQSLQRKREVQDFVAEYGQVIVDECHHLSAITFERVLKQVKARYVVGLTATPFRKDGHQPIFFMQCGPIRFSLSARKAAESAAFEHSVIPRHTDFSVPGLDGEVTIQDLYAAMVTDAARNDLIIRDLKQAIQSGRSPLLLTGRTDHLEEFAAKLSTITPNVFVLRGGMGRKQRRFALESLAAVPESEPRVILATGSYVGEGFDDARLDTLFLAMPVSWKGTLQQYVGRLHRTHHNKKEVRVYDYVDAQVPMLARMFKKRLTGYDAIGYLVESGEQRGSLQPSKSPQGVRQRCAVPAELQSFTP